MAKCNGGENINKPKHQDFKNSLRSSFNISFLQFVNPFKASKGQFSGKGKGEGEDHKKLKHLSQRRLPQLIFPIHLDRESQNPTSYPGIQSMYVFLIAKPL